MRGSIGDGARDRRALLLAARERDAALADHRVVAVREVGDVLVEPGDGRRRQDPLALAERRTGTPGPPPRRRGRTRRCRRACRRTGTAPAARSRSAPRSTASGRSRTSTPSMNTVPGGGSCSRASRLTSVDLPEPVGPTIATVWPAVDARRHVVQHRRRRRSANVRSRNSISPRIPATSRLQAGAAAADRPRIDRRFRVEHLQHPLPRRHAALQQVRDPAERDHRPAEQRQVGVEGDELRRA